MNVTYKDASTTIKVFKNHICLHVFDCKQIDAEKMLLPLDHLHEEVKKMYQKIKQKNKIVLVFDLRQGTSLSLKLVPTLIAYLKKTKPFFRESLNHSHIVGVNFFWKQILLILDKMISTARPIHIDKFPEDMMRVFD